MSPKPAKSRIVRRTVSLPKNLYEEARSVVASPSSPANSINSLFVSAIRAYVRLIRRREIDAKFAEMSSDPEYRKEAEQLSEEFSASDWEAFAQAERDASS